MLGQRAVEASEKGMHPGNKSSNLCPSYGALGFLKRWLSFQLSPGCAPGHQKCSAAKCWDCPGSRFWRRRPIFKFVRYSTLSPPTPSVEKNPRTSCLFFPHLRVPQSFAHFYITCPCESSDLRCSFLRVGQVRWEEVGWERGARWVVKSVNLPTANLVTKE